MSTGDGILFEKRCRVCGEPLAGLSGGYCSRSCRIKVAEFWSFVVLGSILDSSRWAGAPSQAEMLAQYLRQRMVAAMKRLSESEELLGEVLIEIAEIVQEEREMASRANGSLALLACSVCSGADALRRGRIFDIVEGALFICRRAILLACSARFFPRVGHYFGQSLIPR
jgi:hypothetical protein